MRPGTRRSRWRRRSHVLVVDGRIDAVIDFGAAGVGDPAMDLAAEGVRIVGEVLGGG